MNEKLLCIYNVFRVEEYSLKVRKRKARTLFIETIKIETGKYSITKCTCKVVEEIYSFRLTLKISQQFSSRISLLL